MPSASLPAQRAHPLGTGWAFPPAFSRLNTSVNLSSDIQNIEENLLILFSTDWGERIMLPTYGTPLRQYVFAALTQTTSHQLILDISNAIAAWEQRIDVVNVEIANRDVFSGSCELVVEFRLRATGQQGIITHPFQLVDGDLNQVGG